MFKMKKSLVAALTGALMIGATATTFAAPSDNPFSDVPEGHWAYQAVIDLTEAGIIEGYGDGTFRGNRNITRYEMAQMVARALAKFPTATVEIDESRIDDVEARVDDVEARVDDVEARVDDFDGRVDEIDGKIYDTNGRIDALGNTVDSTSLNTGNSGLTQAQQRELLNKLRAEFAPELKRLGVLEDRVDDLDGRVSDLERNADMVKWTGKIEYTYGHMEHKYNDGTKDKSMGHDGVFRLEPSAEVSDHWKAIARFDANYNGKNDSTGYYNSDEDNGGVKLKRVYAQGDYDKFGVKIGRFGYCPAIEDGLVFDTVISGAELSFGSKWKAIVTAGRVGADSDEAHYNYTRNAEGLDRGGADHTDVVSINLQYDPGDSGLYGGASYYYAKDKDYAAYSKKANEDKAGVWAAGLGYKFSNMLDLHGSYANNSKADYQDYGWAVDLRYGNYGDYSEKGNWAIWAGYARFGNGVALGTSQGDDVQTNAKGWHVGAAYAPFKNVGLLARYSDGKWIEDGSKYKKIFGRVEFFF